MPAQSRVDPVTPTQTSGEPRAGQFGPDIYATWRGSTLGEITEALEHRLIFQLAGPLQGCSVLDVGCGDGSLALLSFQNGAMRVQGCDSDPRMVARTQGRFAEAGASIDLTVAQAQALPFPDNSFDIVFCITVLAFVPDAGTGVREMARVLRPGGRLVIGDLGKWSFWAARRRVRGWLGAAFWRAARFRTARQIAALAASAGLSVMVIRGAIFFPPWTALARVMAPLDPVLGRHMTVGAAFLAVQATKSP